MARTLAAVACVLSIKTSRVAADGPEGLVLGGKVGAGIGKPLNEAGPSVAAQLELGYVLPPLDHTFEPFLAFAYSAPSLEGTSRQSDPRLPGDGIVRYRVDQQIGALDLGVRARLPLAAITPYAAAGGRMFMLRSTVSGEVAGEPFGSSEETGTAWGAFFAAGAELNLGPGALLAELQLGYGGVDAFVLRDTNAGALSLFLGYRLMLPPPRPARGSPEAALDDGRDDRVEDTPSAKAANPVSTPSPVPAPNESPQLDPTPAAATPAPEEVPPTPAAPAATEGVAQIRGHVRAFSGEALRATIRVQPHGMKASTDAEGYFELNVQPGQYTVHLRANGYVSQTRRVAVDANGVTVLNVELGKK